MCFGISISNVALDFVFELECIVEAERSNIFIAVLFFHHRKVYRPFMNSGRSTGLESSHRKTEISEALCQL